MILNIRGYKILCYAKHGNRDAYIRLYESYSDTHLAELEKETQDYLIERSKAKLGNAYSELQGSRSK